jgi:two-component sensor histidine kinase
MTVNGHIGIYLLLTVFISLLNSCTSDKKQPQTLSVASADTATISAIIKKANAFVQTNFDSMRIFADTALAMSLKTGFREGEARAKAVIANYYRRKGNYTDAISLGLEVSKLYDSLGMRQANVRLKTLIADTYKEMGGEKGTLEFLEKGLELARESQHASEEMDYPDGVVNALNQQGIIYRDIAKRSEHKFYMDTALMLYMRGLAIIEKRGDDDGNLGKLLNNISQIYNEHYKDYDKALEYLFKAVDYNNKNNNYMSLSYNYGNISSVYASLKDYAKAKSYAHGMLEISDKLNAPHRKVNAYAQLMRVSRDLKQYDSALYFYQWSTTIADSLSNVEKTAQIADMQTKYETVKKESRISELSELNEVKSQRLWLLAGLALLMASLVLMFIMQNRRLQQQKKQIAEQSDRLQWMMKELHHRVKNNLQIVSSLLNLQSYRLKDEESISAIRESQLRVQAMSLMHQRLYQVDDVSMVNFKLYLDDLVESLMKAYGYGPDDFDLKIDVAKEYLDVDTVMPMGLLVNEIITNSFKYAYGNVARPSLTIQLAASDKQLKLDIADNGPGMTEGKDKKPGFGKKLIAALTQQLKANYTVNTTSGTAYQFTIPYTKEKAA